MMLAEDRFEAGAPAYAAYLQTVEGRLRLDLAWQNLREFIDEMNDEPPREARSKGRSGGAVADTSCVVDEPCRRALDLGGGTGAQAIRLAAAGWHVAVIDSSATMLSLAATAARQAVVSERISFHQAEADRAHELFAPQTFAVALCHNVIEYVPDPPAAVKTLSALVRPGGIISLLARNRVGEAMRAALKAHDLDVAVAALNADQVNESLYGGPARVFDADSLNALAKAASLEALAVRGVRVLADYLPASLSESEEAYARLCAFEYKIGARPDLAAVARYTQIIARR